MHLTFYWYYSVNCLPVYITIFNDDINEAYHQLFAIRLSLVSSQNPSMVVMSRNISMGIIIDDDRKLRKNNIFVVIILRYLPI